VLLRQRGCQHSAPVLLLQILLLPLLLLLLLPLPLLLL
jgi:hypothetical protein